MTGKMVKIKVFLAQGMNQLSTDSLQEDYELYEISPNQEFEIKLQEFEPDIIIVDHREGWTAPAFLNSKERIPVVFIMDNQDRKLAVDLIEQGAADVIFDDKTFLIKHTISRVLRFHLLQHQLEKEKHEALTSNRLLEVLLQSIPAAVSYKNLHGQYLKVNKAFETFVGQSRNHILDDFDYHILPATLRDVEHEYDKKVSQQEKTQSFEQYVGKKNGKDLFIETIKSPVYDDDNKIQGVVSVRRDISDHKEREQKLEMSKKLLDEAQRMAKTGSFQWRVNENVFDATDEFKRIIGKTNSYFGVTFRDYINSIHELDRNFVVQQIEESQQSRKPYQIEHRLISHNGSAKVVKSSGVLRSHEDQGITFLSMFGTIQDITERREMDKAMHQGQEIERKRLSREIHDGLGQLLIALKFNLMNLEEQIEENNTEGNSKETLGAIKKMDDLIDNIVDDIRRIINDLSIKSIEELGLHKAIIGLCRQINEANSLDLNLEIEINDEDITEDKAIAIYRVAQESLNNIAKYAKAKHVKVQLFQSEESLNMNIEDDGIGFDVNKKPKNTKGGNGLLNMNQRIKVFNGSFDLKSEPGNGTRIEIRIPNKKRVQEPIAVSNDN